MRRRLGKFVPSHVIRDRMDRTDLRFEAEARENARLDAALAAFRARTSSAALFPTRPPVVDVAIEPVSADNAGPVVDVTLVPAMFTEPLPRYTVEARGLVWAVIDRTNARYRLPSFHSEACAIACCAALNLQGAK